MTLRLVLLWEEGTRPRAMVWAQVGDTVRAGLFTQNVLISVFSKGLELQTHEFLAVGGGSCAW